MSISRRTFLASAAGAPIALPLSTTARQHGTPAVVTPEPDTADREARLHAAMDEHGIPGAVVLLDSPETGVWSAALGVANLKTGEPMTTGMYLRIGSITKTFTSTMILQLVDQGALAMDHTLASLLPSQASLPNAETVTLRHLLTMRSGIPDYLQAFDILSPDPHEVVTDEGIIDTIADLPADFAPGEQQQYSNTNYILLGMIARVVTGTPWPELLQSSVLDEAGLEQTLVPTGPDIPDPAPRGYLYPEAMKIRMAATPASGTPDASAEPLDVTQVHPSLSGAAGSMISTMDDLHTWMGVLLNGTLLSPELQAARIDVSGDSARADPIAERIYGLGLIHTDGAIGHDGGITGFRSTMFTWPETGTTLITVANVIPARTGQDPAAILTSAVLGE